MVDQSDSRTGRRRPADTLVVLEQPDAPDGRPWLVCALQPVLGMPTYTVVSSHAERDSALAEMLCPDVKPLFWAVRAALPWLDRDGNRLVHHVRRLARALRRQGYAVRPIG